MKSKRKIIQIDEDLCDGCGQCMIACAEAAIELVDGKAHVVADRYCDGLGACLGECPQGALTIIEREAEEFDEKAVEERLLQQQLQDAGMPAHSCPSVQPRQFAACPSSKPSQRGASDSKLSTWPVQLRLVAPDAPFLENADLLVAADCTAFAYPDVHRDFFKGRVVLCGCPKLDDQEAYVQKFTEIFKRNVIKSVTVLVMEVPCCGGMPMIIQKAMDAAGAQVPMETVTIGIEGGIIRRGA
ncbi:MAG: 4Fe-4S dicluster domain-containing protein [Deltaproteobacteria bacterium]|nr:4Fe-4S dicluster domain-containing protein [Deltaproteobacteria bacterium]